MDEQSVLAEHDRLWERRSGALGRWQAAMLAREQAVEAARRHERERETALRRASGGLTARQRAYAQEHAPYPTRPRGPDGREVVVTWIYRREQIQAAETRATQIADEDARALTDAAGELADATRELLTVWGAEAARVTGQPRRRLRAFAARHT